MTFAVANFLQNKDSFYYTQKLLSLFHTFNLFTSVEFHRRNTRSKLIVFEFEEQVILFFALKMTPFRRKQLLKNMTRPHIISTHLSLGVVMINRFPS